MIWRDCIKNPGVELEAPPLFVNSPVMGLCTRYKYEGQLLNTLRIHVPITEMHPEVLNQYLNHAFRNQIPEQFDKTIIRMIEQRGKKFGQISLLEHTYSLMNFHRKLKDPTWLFSPEFLTVFKEALTADPTGYLLFGKRAIPVDDMPPKCRIVFGDFGGVSLVINPQIMVSFNNEFSVFEAKIMASIELDRFDFFLGYP